MPAARFAPLISVVFVFLSGCGGDGFQPRAPRNVHVTVLEPQLITRSVQSHCRLLALDEAVVSVSVPSIVEEVLVSSGDMVVEGQTLLVLRTDDMRRASISDAAAMLEAARAAGDYAEATLARAHELYEGGAMSLHDYQRRVTETQASRATLTQARAGYSAAVASSGQGFVRAPFSGMVGRVIATPGNPAAGALLSIFSTGATRAELLVAPRHLPLLRPGLPAAFSTSHYPGELFSGSVTSFSAGADPVSGLVSLTVQFTDTDGQLMAGLSGTATVFLETRDSALVLGENALSPVGDGQWEVKVVRGGMAETVSVITGIRSGSRYEILQGLAQGDSVITLGHTLVADGEPVTAVNR